MSTNPTQVVAIEQRPGLTGRSCEKPALQQPWNQNSVTSHHSAQEGRHMMSLIAHSDTRGAS